MIQGSHILVIDDERGIREMLSYDLRQSGQWVATASCAQDGLERLKNRRFDLVLLDIMKPGMSGIDALKAIKQSSPDTTVIMMTGHATVETAVASLKAGAADYIQKPFELEELEVMITRELERKKLSALVAMYQAGLAALETRDYQILLIDDEPSLLRSIKRILGSRHEVLLAESGEDGLALIREHPSLHAVICDLLMPGLTGMEVYTRACELNPALKDRFIFMTGDAYTASAKEFADRFKEWILTKPFHVADLERLLQQRIGASDPRS